MNFDGIGFLYMLRLLFIHLNAYKYKINYFHKFNNLTKRERTAYYLEMAGCTQWPQT